MEAVPEEEQDTQPYFNIPYLTSPEPTKSTSQIQSIVKTEPPSDAEQQRRREMEREKEEKERAKQQEREKERERAAERAKAEEREKEEREKEKEKEKERGTLADRVKESLEHLPVVLPPLVISVLSGDVSETTPEVYQICSTLRGPNGPILKFSELFAPDVKVPLPKSAPNPGTLVSKKGNPPQFDSIK